MKSIFAKLTVFLGIFMFLGFFGVVYAINDEEEMRRIFYSFGLDIPFNKIITPSGLNIHGGQYQIAFDTETNNYYYRQYGDTFWDTLAWGSMNYSDIENSLFNYVDSSISRVILEGLGYNSDGTIRAGSWAAQYAPADRIVGNTSEIVEYIVQNTTDNPQQQQALTQALIEGRATIDTTPEGKPIVRYLPKAPKKCNRNVLRECNTFPLDERGNVKRAYRKHVVEENCGWAIQLNGCGEKLKCYLGDCCTPTAPAKPNELAYKTNNASSTELSEKTTLSGLEVFDNGVFSWKNVNFGKTCLQKDNSNNNSIQIFNNFFTEGVDKKFLGGTGWLSQRRLLNKPIGDILGGAGLCSQEVLFRVASNNGSKKSYSAWKKINLTDMAPEVSNITTSIDFNKESDALNDTVKIIASAKGPFIQNIEIGYVMYSQDGVEISPYKEIINKNCNKKKVCNVNTNWDINISRFVDYKIVATAYNKCGETAGTYEYYLSDTESASITVNINVFDKLLDPQEKPQCADNSEISKLERGIVQLESNTSSYKEAIYIQPNTPTTFVAIPKEAFPLTLTSNVSQKDCIDYKHLCINGSDLTQSYKIEYPDQPTATVDIIFGGIRPESWAQFVNTDMYTKSLSVSATCETPTTTSTFDKKTVVTTDDNTNTTIYTADQSNIDIQSIADDSTSSSYVQNLNYRNSLEIESDDTWIENYVFPEVNTIQNSAKTITNINEINENDNVYYINSDLTILNEYRYKTNGLTIVYVNGNLNINNSIIAEDEESFITFVVNGSITVGNGFGVNDYTNPAVYNAETNPNITAGLVMLDEDGSITFIGTDDYQNNPDVPLVFKGLILSKGAINMNRDLGINNNNYPSFVVLSLQDYLSRFKELGDLQNTGLETFDIQWNYVE